MVYTKARARHACEECHARRIRCDVTEMQPCSNCRSCGGNCEVLTSKRGRYPRKTREKRTAAGAAIAASGTLGTATANLSNSLPPTHATSGSISSSIILSHKPNQPLKLSPAEHQPQTPTSLFFGESNFLTLFPGPLHLGDEIASLEDAQINRLSFPISSALQTDNVNATTASMCPIKTITERYLIEGGALTFPSLDNYLPALRAYFTWFHPCFPILDRVDVAQGVRTGNISPLLLQAILFIAATYCDESTITAMDFKDRSEAKHLLYTRAKLLFDAEWEGNQVTTVQALFLLSFWRGGPPNVRDVRYWLGVVITLAQTHGLHRSTRFTTKDSKMARMRRRIWWSIYVRERQASASLGLPSRIRDEDCDIEFLTPSDLEADPDDCLATSFGICKPEHITYVIKMIDIARLLGKILDIRFVPGWKSSNSADVHNLGTALEEWKQGLTDDMRKWPDKDEDSIWTSLLYLAYNHLRILIHRNGFLQPRNDRDKDATISAACQISRITEDMLSQKMIQFGQMHMITSLFAALCIHAIEIRMTNGVGRRLAVHRAQMCLLGLMDIQKFWKINNHVLDLFFQYLDEPIAKKLQGDGTENRRLDNLNSSAISSNLPPTNVENVLLTTSESLIPPLQEGTILDEDQFLDFLSLNWEGENTVVDLEQFLDPLKYENGPWQGERLNFLERYL